MESGSKNLPSQELLKALFPSRFNRNNNQPPYPPPLNAPAVANNAARKPLANHQDDRCSYPAHHQHDGGQQRPAAAPGSDGLLASFASREEKAAISAACNSAHPAAAFEKLYEQHQQQSAHSSLPALFFHAWALSLEKEERFDEAGQVYAMGVRHHARPVEGLQAEMDALRRRQKRKQPPGGGAAQHHDQGRLQPERATAATAVAIGGIADGAKVCRDPEVGPRSPRPSQRHASPSQPHAPEGQRPPRDSLPPLPLVHDKPANQGEDFGARTYREHLILQQLINKGSASPGPLHSRGPPDTSPTRLFQLHTDPLAIRANHCREGATLPVKVGGRDGSLRVGRVLGRGSFARVHAGRWREQGGTEAVECAVKIQTFYFGSALRELYASSALHRRAPLISDTRPPQSPQPSHWLTGVSLSLHGIDLSGPEDRVARRLAGDGGGWRDGQGGVSVMVLPTMPVACDMHTAINEFFLMRGRYCSEVVSFFLVYEVMGLLMQLHQVGLLSGDLKTDNLIVADMAADRSRHLAIPGPHHDIKPTRHHPLLDAPSPIGVFGIDLGRALDTHAVYPDCIFKGDCHADDLLPPAMLSGLPWMHHADLAGVAAIAHILLFGKYPHIQPLPIHPKPTRDAGPSLTAAMSMPQWGLAPNARFPRGGDEIWQDLFHSLINFCPISVARQPNAQQGAGGRGRGPDAVGVLCGASVSVMCRLRGAIEGWFGGEHGGGSGRKARLRCELEGLQRDLQEWCAKRGQMKR
ncbi:unnamed protein product [Vitrella brassicaformis CCMP3155]|uniref:Protein kinase domain-containing protein n=1 Tax=Vitrella brassicaformis (strain CCMP3155) TaxID=1169540 RepID=A0A0G4GFV2_VITBC|nr:unnamed protein product [Vitrella brassicaformis CCMP3155]|eukprot:CEM28193.1 unnamed protein product [Vitrella brassicaformis CCMP3155]